MAKILVIGSVAIDEVVEVQGAFDIGGHNAGHWVGRRVGGGAANTAMALVRAGHQALLVSAVGMDEAGVWLVEALTRLGVDTSRIDRQAEATTRSWVLLEAHGERTIVNLTRARVPLSAELAELAADCCYVRSADPRLSGVLRQRVRAGRVVAHIPPLEDGLRPAQVLVGSASDLPAAFLADPYGCGRRIAGDVLEWVVVTYGAQGARAYGPDTVLRQAAAQQVVVDSTGAGDVFAAGLCQALASGQAMACALQQAVRWGSASVGYAGTVPPPGFPRLPSA